MLLEGRVLRVEASRVVVDILGEEATLLFENISPPGRDQEDIEERFAKGKTIRARVRGRNQRGRLQLTMRKP
jgi:exosome complex RNA-binding protein Rrp4